MKQKINKKGLIAGVLSITLLSTAVAVYMNKKEAKAFSSSYGVCIDKTGYSTNHYWHGADTYSNKLLNINDYTPGTPEYDDALSKNVGVLHQLIGSDEDILKIFWSGIITYVIEEKSFGGTDLTGAQYWINYAQRGYQESVFHGYANPLNTTFYPMTETDLGKVLHGTAGQEIINRDPFLAVLTNPHTLFEENYDATRNYQTDPLALPRLGNAWLKSYDSYEAGEGGRGQWPKDSSGHEVAVQEGEIPAYEQVQAVALDMETNSNYFSIQDMTKKSLLSDDGEIVDDDDDGPGSSANKQKNYYVINCTEDFFNNCGSLNVWDNNLNGTGGWVSIGSLTHYDQTTNVMGWDIKPSSQPNSWTFEFTYTGGNKPTGLVMYFDIPNNSIADANAIGFNNTTEFVAAYLKLYTCDKCPKGTDIHAHQRHIAFNPAVPTHSYPCFRLGGDDPNWEPVDANVNFEIFRHKEDWTSNYNVQLEKKDYETGKPLETTRQTKYNI